MMEVLMPNTLAEALSMISKDGHDVLILGSGSDVIPRIREREIEPKKVLDLSGLGSELNYIRTEGKVIRIGALVTVRQIIDNELFKGRLEAFLQAGRMFGGPQIRNMATVGGNLGAASSSEDLIPIFIALDARVKMASIDGDRLVPVSKLVVAKRQIDRRPNEIIREIYFEMPDESSWTAFFKAGRRNSLIIDLINMAMYMKLNIDGTKIEDIRVALNRVRGKTPERAYKTEEYLRGKRIENETIARAQEVLDSEVQLSSDFRASAEYRKSLDKVILARLINNCRDRIVEGRRTGN
ncbi:MAG: FAD binding domain-containing protein [Nitrososphaerota archaeon]|nr:FAD binding domain-containing protein [Nitrososphaerota archaeon]